MGAYKMDKIGERSPIGIHAVLQKSTYDIGDMWTIKIHNFVYLEHTLFWEIACLEYAKLQF